MVSECLQLWRDHTILLRSSQFPGSAFELSRRRQLNCNIFHDNRLEAQIPSFMWQLLHVVYPYLNRSRSQSEYFISGALRVAVHVHQNMNAIGVNTIGGIAVAGDLRADR